jgi:glycosyltransferase involved in cell wall biosynthesis
MFVIHSLGYGGAERQLVNLAKGLAQLNHEVVVVTFYPGGPLEQELWDAGVAVWTLNKGNRLDIPRSIWKLVSLVRQMRPDILHGYLTTPNLLSLIVKIFCPSTRIVWGVRASNVDWKTYDYFTRFWFRCECALSRFPDLIIVNSFEGARYHLSHGFPNEKIIVIHNGIDTDRFKPDNEARGRVRHEWGIREGEKLVGLVGRLDPMKDHPTFLKAAASMIARRKNIRFVCIGRGSITYQTYLRSLGDKLGLSEHVTWIDPRQDIHIFYNALDVAVSSSAWGEGFPNVVAEAMASGVWCVVTDVGDSACLVERTGQVVPANSPEAMARAIEISLQDGHEAKPELVRKRIVQNFAIGKMVELTEKALKQAAGVV